MANKETYPIKKTEDLRDIYNQFIRFGYEREAHMLIIGCNLALRFSDLHKLKFEDIGKNRHFMNEQKTSKDKAIKFNDQVIKHVKLLKQYYQSQNIEPVYLFQSTSRRTKNQEPKPITIQTINKRFQEVAESLRLDYPIGTHTMRKTWGFNAFYIHGLKLVEIKRALNHSSAKDTEKYIGVTQDIVEKNYDIVSIGVL